MPVETLSPFVIARFTCRVVASGYLPSADVVRSAGYLESDRWLWDIALQLLCHVDGVEVFFTPQLTLMHDLIRVLLIQLVDCADDLSDGICLLHG